MQINANLVLTRRHRRLWSFVAPRSRLIRPRCCRPQSGQAIVELALTLTFIMMLMSAATDLGLAYKTSQTLINATAEAASFLDMNPALSCSTTGCDPVATADAEALNRFRTEQGTVIHGIASTLDLNANHIDDLTESGGAAYVASMFRIDEADNTQIDATSGSTFALGTNYDPNATDAQCKNRAAVPLSTTNPNVTSCYIVIRSAITYKPFALKTILGDAITIRAISVRRIVKGS